VPDGVRGLEFGTPPGTTKEVHVTTDSATPSPIVLIHGLWLTPLSWEYWVERFEGKGHRVLAPAWPGLDKPIEELRRNTAPYERLGITEITDHYDAIIRGLDEPPIIIGHSFGGLITMLLLDRGLGASAVAISPAQPKGVLTLPPAQARVASVALRNPANRHKAQMLTEKQFHYGFTNTLSEAESKPIYDRYAVPGPGRVLFQAALANFNPNAASKINFKNDDRAPLLIMANGKDHTVPAASARATFKLQSKSKATTVLREYADRPHLTAGVVGWEEIADYALDWTTHHLAAAKQASVEIA
jgi:pimeloyl-ACP methyl ester carboxylesterase